MSSNGNGNGNGIPLPLGAMNNKVTNQADAPLSGAMFTLKDSASNMATLMMTGMDGMYPLTNLPLARCTVKEATPSANKDVSPLCAITVILEPGECDKNNYFVDKQKGSLIMSLVLATTASGGHSNE